MAGKVQDAFLIDVPLRNKPDAQRQDERKERNRYTDDNAFSAIVFNDRLCSLHERSPDTLPAPKAGSNRESVVGIAGGDETGDKNSPICCRWAIGSISRTEP